MLSECLRLMKGSDVLLIKSKGEHAYRTLPPFHAGAVMYSQQKHGEKCVLKQSFLSLQVECSRMTEARNSCSDAFSAKL